MRKRIGFRPIQAVVLLGIEAGSWTRKMLLAVAHFLYLNSEK